MFRSMMSGNDVFVVASAFNNVDCHAAQPDVASHNDYTKVLDWRIFCNSGCRETIFIAGAIALHCDGEES
jgi:hypothetical protein